MKMSVIYWSLMCIGLLSVARCGVQSQDSLQDEFWKQRNVTLQAEFVERLGGEIKLTSLEDKVNDKLMQFKYEEIANAEKSGFFPPSEHFFKAKDAIEKESDVFKIIRKVPKGGALHLHDSSMTDVRWLINQTYSDHCYMCFKKGLPNFKFMDAPRTDPDCDEQWVPVNYLRKHMYKDPKMFDDMLYRNMTMCTENPREAYPTQGKIWEKFYGCFGAEDGVFRYRPVFRDYFYQALQEFYDDNVQYLEFRVLLPQLYELNGTTHDKDYVIDLYRQTLKEFMKSHPDFIGAKIIYSTLRLSNEKDVLSKVKETMTFLKKYPGFVLGFDLVGREDDGYPLTHFLDELLYPQQQNPPIKVPYFFHAGETDWEGTTIDDNLVSAVFLNSSRIGHGFALPKHPIVMKLVKSRGIAVEVNPVSNQVLGLVSDLRNHPGAVLFAHDVPLVISSDDPALWGALPLSHDFYEAFMGLAGKQGDLRTLKQLAINSILYSGMSEAEKLGAFKKWNAWWDIFIKETVALYKL